MHGDNSVTYLILNHIATDSHADIGGLHNWPKVYRGIAI